MRLIDADRLKEVIDRNFAHPDGFKEIIDIQPTAYDVNEVVERMEANSIYTSIDVEAFVMLDDAVKIIKAEMKG